jgi:hypothetical protein
MGSNSKKPSLIPQSREWREGLGYQSPAKSIWMEESIPEFVCRAAPLCSHTSSFSAKASLWLTPLRTQRVRKPKKFHPGLPNRTESGRYESGRGEQMGNYYQRMQRNVRARSDFASASLSFFGWRLVNFILTRYNK